MKKTNNRYRNNSSSTIYSLNYKFDSNSIAGKISGTALDLIKRYNDLAKDAHSNNDYVTAEIFRQYAEHYRKIVTEINERKNAREQYEANDNNIAQVAPASENNGNESSADETGNSEEAACAEAPAVANVNEDKADEQPVRRSFHVIDVTNKTNQTSSEENVKPKRVYRRRVATEG